MKAISSINNIQPIEYASLVATYHYIFDNEFNCNNCKKKYSLTVRNDKKGCAVKKPTNFIKYDDILSFSKCPSNFYNSLYANFIDMFSLFSQGVLPFEGGLLDQPAKIIDIFKMVENLQAENLKKAKEKAEKWQKTKSRSSSPLMNKKR
jgi:hypothetical protein